MRHLPIMLIMVFAAAVGCTAPAGDNGDGGQDTSGKAVVNLTPIRDVVQNPEDYAGMEITVNGTLERQKSGSLYFWYIVDPQEFSLPVDYTQALGSSYDQEVFLLMLSGTVELSGGRSSLSDAIIVTPDFATTDYVLVCSDGTYDSECSATKPLYCDHGSLANRSSACGCPAGQVSQADGCISQYNVGPAARTFGYVLGAIAGTVQATFYSGFNDHIAGLETPDEVIDYLNYTLQYGYMDGIVGSIRSKTTNTHDQARIAVNFVQAIPDGADAGRYPYEVLYDNEGSQAEKARLMLFLLREIGFSTALFSFENYTAVGIGCQPEYDYRNSGYCFIEPGVRAIITDDSGYYIGAVKQTSVPETVQISSGSSLDSASGDYIDAQDWKDVNIAIGESGELGGEDYNTWVSLVNKYGIETEES